MKKKCKHNGGYTEGYICRICKEPIYTKKQAKEIDYLREQSGKAEEWEKRFDRKFGKYMFGMLSKEECLSVKTFISQILSRQREELIENILKGFNKYKCDFNWDFDKNKEKHKEYIALSGAIKVIREMKP